MVKIRLSRFGSKKHPYYHIVAADSQRARDCKFLEQLGVYDPSKPMAEAKLNRERLQYWLGVGAQVSTSVAKVVREQAKVAAG